MAKILNTRAHAARICWQIIDHGRSLDSAIAEYVSDHEPSVKDKGFVQELVYGLCRWYGELEQVSKNYLRSPIRKKDRVVHFLLLIGFYQLRYLNTADHAAISETVQACKQLNKVWAKQLVNGCLRNHQRSPAEVADAVTRSHPSWLVEAITKAWPNHALAIMHANNQRPPMCLRVNRLQYHRDDYLSTLRQQGIDAQTDPYSDDGIVLKKPYGVNKLPGFESGACSVQDTAAQLAATLMDLAPGHTVLDACAAPGGKTAHMLECMDNQGEVHALDISEKRCEQLESTLRRLNLTAGVFCADATTEPSWPLPNNGYDRILIDAPCSGIGVIRRHPDIKHHRRPNDVRALNKTQYALLVSLWPHLKPGGKLLYMTCSILPSENNNQLKRFVQNTPDAMVVSVDHPSALTQTYGVQTLPGVHSMDGFYYGLLVKRDN